MAIKITHAMGRSKGPYISVKKAEYVDDYRIRLVFNDGIERVVDFGNYLRHARHPDIRKYLDIKKFKNFRLRYGQLDWPNFDIRFPISELHSGKIKFTKSEKGLFAGTPDEAIDFTRPDNRVLLPPSTIKRLKANAKKEDVSLELL